MNLKRLRKIVNEVPEEFDETIVVFSDSRCPEIYNEVASAQLFKTHDFMGTLYTDDFDQIDMEKFNQPVFLIEDE